MKKWYQGNEQIEGKMNLFLRELYREFGMKTRIAAPLIGRYALNALKKEAHRLEDEWTQELRPFYEKNAAALSLETADIAVPEHVEQLDYTFDLSNLLAPPVRRAGIITDDPIEIQSQAPSHPNNQALQPAMKFQP